MDNDKFKRNIIIVKDYFEDNIIDFIKQDDNNVQFQITSLDNIPSILETSPKNIPLLIICKYDFYHLKREEIIKIFKLRKDSSEKNYFLLLEVSNDNNDISDYTKESSIYCYLLPDLSNLTYSIAILRKNLESYIHVILESIMAQERLNEYIMDSFKTIVDSELVKSQKEQIEKLNQELEIISKTDYLTKLLNRKAIFEAINISRTKKNRNINTMKRNLNVGDNNEVIGKEPISRKKIQDFVNHFSLFSCLMIDIDDFKKVNDFFGHKTGDKVLEIFGDILIKKNIFRNYDIIGRYGGEEFLVFLPETNIFEAQRITERFLKVLREKEIEIYPEKNIKVTVSIGISSGSLITEKDTEDLISHADQAMYIAKMSGKNRFSIYND